VLAAGHRGATGEQHQADFLVIAAGPWQAFEPESQRIWSYITTRANSQSALSIALRVTHKVICLSGFYFLSKKVSILLGRKVQAEGRTYVKFSAEFHSSVPRY
jgi:hypothetical protein